MPAFDQTARHRLCWPSLRQLAADACRTLAPACIAVLYAVVACDSAASSTLTVSPSIVLRDDAANPVGINLNYLKDHEALRPPGTESSLAEALTSAKLGSLRFPGGEKSDNYLWTTPIGSLRPIARGDPVPAPLAPRIISRSLWPGNDATFAHASGDFVAPTLDFDAFIDLCRRSGAEPIVVLAYDSAREVSGLPDAPPLAELIESAAAWVNYANITRRYGVKFWEIGNESWLIPGQTAARYASHVAQFASALRSVDPSILIGAHGKGLAAWQTLLELAGNSVDWLSVHDYPAYGWSSGYRPSPQDLTLETDFALQAIGDGPHTIGVTEINAIDWDPAGWPNRNDTGHALVVFDLIGQQLLKPKVSFVQLWNTRWINNLTHHPASTGNLVPNGDFEQELQGWTGRGGHLDQDTRRSGNASLAQTGGGFHSRTLAGLEAGRTYTLRAWGKTDTLTVWSGIGVDCFEGDRKLLGVSRTVPSSSWTELVMPFEIPSGTTHVTLWVSTAAGDLTTHFDDLSVDDALEPEVHDALTPANGYQPVGRALALWSEFLPRQLIKTTSTSRVTAYAGMNPTTRDLTLWLLNHQTNEEKILLDFDDYTPAPAALRWVFEGQVPEDTAPTWSGPFTLELPGPTRPVTLPALSITLLRVSQAP